MPKKKSDSGFLTQVHLDKLECRILNNNILRTTRSYEVKFLYLIRHS